MRPIEIDPVFEAKLARADGVVQRLRNRSAWIALLGVAPSVAVSLLLIDWNESFWGIGWLLIGLLAGNIVHAFAVRFFLARVDASPDEAPLVRDLMRERGLLPAWRSLITSSIKGY